MCNELDGKVTDINDLNETIQTHKSEENQERPLVDQVLVSSQVHAAAVDDEGVNVTLEKQYIVGKDNVPETSVWVPASINPTKVFKPQPSDVAARSNKDTETQVGNAMAHSQPSKPAFPLEGENRYSSQIYVGEKTEVGKFTQKEIGKTQQADKLKLTPEQREEENISLKPEILKKTETNTVNITQRSPPTVNENNSNSKLASSFAKVDSSPGDQEKIFHAVSTVKENGGQQINKTQRPKTAVEDRRSIVSNATDRHSSSVGNNAAKAFRNKDFSTSDTNVGFEKKQF